MAAQFVPRPDARQQQQLRGAEGPGREDHLAGRLDHLAPAAHPCPDTLRVAAFQHDGFSVAAGQDGQVGPAGGRPQERHGAAAAAPVALRHLVEPGAFLVDAVEVRVRRDASTQRRLHEGMRGSHRIAQVRDRQLTARGVELVRAANLVLGTLEVGQHVGVAPALVAQRSPVVVVGAVAAHIDHRVDGAGPAEGPAARLVALPAVQSGLRHRLVGPVEVAGRHRTQKSRRDVDQRRAVRRPCLQQAHRSRGVGAEPVGQHATGRTAANDDVIEAHEPPPVRPPRLAARWPSSKLWRARR